MVPPSHTQGPPFPGHQSAPQKLGPASWKPGGRPPFKQEEPEIQVIESEDEEEEVLVDDFDGQCCRTYPYNHSKIQRWREGRKEKKEKEKHKHLANVQSVKTPTSIVEKVVSTSKQTEAVVTTVAGSIPVGIVSARQRPEQEKPGPSCAPSLPVPPSGPLPPGHPPPACGPGMGPSTWSSGPPPPWPLGPGQPPPGGPSSAPYGPPPPWAHPPGPLGMGPPGPGPAGPIPMGYQLAKDPMTGQILLIPTDHAGQMPGAPAPGFGFGGLPPGMAPPTSSASQHLHHLMLQQQQQHHAYMQHQDMVQHQLRHGGLPPGRPRVPETITVSDDDDEDCAKDKVSNAGSQPGPASDLTKESRPPSPLQIKREIVKTEFKTEPAASVPLPFPAAGASLVDKPLTIKQERQERASLSVEEPVVVGEPSTTEPLGSALLPLLPGPCLALPPPPPVLFKREIKSEVVAVVERSDATACEDTKLCAEALLFMSERSTPPACNEHFAPELQELGAAAALHWEEPTGFDILFQGLQLLAQGSLSAPQLSPIQTLTALAGLDILCSVTRNDTIEYGLPKSILAGSGLNLGLLCAITAEDYRQQLTWVDPVVRLRNTMNVKKYPNQASEKEAKEFISMKIKQFTKDHPESVEEEKYDNIKMLAKMVKKIKNMEIMSQLEVDMRLKITELQNTFREKQKCLSKLKTPKKRNMKNKKGKQRGPGRPKKKKFPNPKAKMGRPRKHPKVVPKMEPPLPEPEPEVKLEKIKQEEAEEEEEEEEDVEEDIFLDSDAPPVLEEEPPVLEEEQAGSPRSRGSLLKPPKLQPSSPPPHAGKDGHQSSAVDARNTTLSTLTSKFMKGKANPFANLLSKLAAPPSVAGGVESDSGGEVEEQEEAPEDDDEEEEEEEKEMAEMPEDPVEEVGELQEAASSVSEPTFGEVERSSSEKSSDDSSSETGSMMSPTRDCSFQFGKTSKLGYGLEAYRHTKKRKSDKPKKHSGGSSETIVPKKPKNLFMMMDFQRGFNAKSAEDEYNFDENDEDKSYKYRDSRKESPTPSAKSQESQWTDDEPHSSPLKRKHKKSKLSKSKSSKKERLLSGSVSEPLGSPEPLDCLRSSQLRASDLKDGLRLLMLQEGKFWPARLNSTKLPDVYGVVMDRQRGNRPIILPRDDILKEAVLEIRPTEPHHLPIGARVCTLWSSALAQLFPGTIACSEDPLPEGHVLVELDDGDSRLVEVSKIRMLPTDYSRVVYDPDPIASLRKRRVSTDSHDSVASHGDFRASHDQPAGTPRKSSKLADNSFPSEARKKSKSSEGGKTKKKHKKCSKHHHCHKHKHKRHKSGGEAPPSGSKKAPDQKFAIRSPPHGGGRFVKSDQDNASSEASQEESDQQNSSDEEASSGSLQARPPHHDLTPGKGRELWQWAGEGYRRPGGKGKSKKLFFRSIQRGKDSLHVNDCAVFLSTGRSDRPYIGKIEMLWETGNGSMMVKVKWFYHPEEIETCGRKFDLKLPGGLFQSPHTDENSVHTISHECEVLPIKEYTRLQATEPRKRTAAMYYLAGSYDPAGLTVHFQPGVLQSNSDSE